MLRFLLFLNFLFFSSPSLILAKAEVKKTTPIASEIKKGVTPPKKEVAPTIKETAPTKTTAQKEIDVDALLEKMDKLFRQESSESEVTMTIENPKWPSSRTVSLRMWAKGEERTLVKITSPKKDKGISTLKIEKNIWNYFPKIAKQIKVPASMMMGSWMGSDFTNDDLVKESSYKKDFKASAKETKGRYEVTLLPKEKTISIWDKITMLIDKRTLLPLEYSFYNERGEKIRTLMFTKPKTFSGITLPSKLTMVSHTEEGKKTSFEYKKMDFSKSIPESFFSFKNLKAKDL